MLSHVDTLRYKQERLEEAEKATVLEIPEADTETDRVPHKWREVTPDLP